MMFSARNKGRRTTARRPEPGRRSSYRRAMSARLLSSSHARPIQADSHHLRITKLVGAVVEAFVYVALWPIALHAQSAAHRPLLL